MYHSEKITTIVKLISKIIIYPDLEEVNVYIYNQYSDNTILIMFIFKPTTRQRNTTGFGSSDI